MVSQQLPFWLCKTYRCDNVFALVYGRFNISFYDNTPEVALQFDFFANILPHVLVIMTIFRGGRTFFVVLIDNFIIW